MEEVLIKQVNLSDAKNVLSPGADQKGKEINAKVPARKKDTVNRFASRNRAANWVQKKMNKMISS